jgi:hypothetical protein
MKPLLLVMAFAFALPGSAAAAKDRGTRIDLSVAEDGSCRARIGDQTILATPEELDARLPALLPDRKAPLRLAASYEKVPDSCFGPVMSALQRLGYDSITFEAEPPPLGPEITSPGGPAQ